VPRRINYSFVAAEHCLLPIAHYPLPIALLPIVNLSLSKVPIAHCQPELVEGAHCPLPIAFAGRFYLPSVAGLHIIKYPNFGIAERYESFYTQLMNAGKPGAVFVV
jgi:hypothetical protein